MNSSGELEKGQTTMVQEDAMFDPTPIAKPASFTKKQTGPTLVQCGTSKNLDFRHYLLNIFENKKKFLLRKQQRKHLAMLIWRFLKPRMFTLVKVGNVMANLTTSSKRHFHCSTNPKARFLSVRSLRST